MATALDWPLGILPSAFDWALQSNGTTFTSPWNRQTQSMRLPGSQWVASMTLSNLDDYESRYVEVMLVEMDGYAGRVKLWDFGREPNVVKGNPKISAAGQMGTNLITKGWTPNVVVLKRGDYFTINDELKMVLADVTSNATGDATVRFGPQLRTSPAADAPLEVRKPYAIFRLAKDKNGTSRKPGINNDFSLDFVEAF